MGERLLGDGDDLRLIERRRACVDTFGLLEWGLQGVTLREGEDRLDGLGGLSSLGGGLRGVTDRRLGGDFCAKVPAPYGLRDLCLRLGLGDEALLLELLRERFGHRSGWPLSAL